MGKIMIVNASPRAPKSNSKQYAELFSKCCRLETEYFYITKANQLELCRFMEQFSDVLFVFPLYVDGIPSTLLDFLKTMEKNSPKKKPVISILINCGFIEPEQNNVAIKIIRLYCKQNGYPFGSILKIGSGEAILATPFRILVKSKIKKFAASISARNNQNLQVTMPISKTMFVKASTAYWERCGKKNGVTKEEMATVQIET